LVVKKVAQPKKKRKRKVEKKKSDIGLVFSTGIDEAKKAGHPGEKRSP